MYAVDSKSDRYALPRMLVAANTRSNAVTPARRKTHVGVRHAEAVLALAPPAPKPLTFDEVVETLTMLHNLPGLLEVIEQADRAALYQALGLTVRYRRVGASEQVKLTSNLVAVELERVGGGMATITTPPAWQREWAA